MLPTPEPTLVIEPNSTLVATHSLTAAPIAKDIYGNELKVVTEIDFDTTPAKPSLNHHTIKWLALIFLALGVLTIQYVRYIAPYWAKNPESYQLSATLCNYLRCSIPPQIDTSKINVDKLMIRNSPEHINVLNVDTIIYNSAKFSQPYPDIDLRFTNTNDQVVAQRRFKPHEYLNKETLATNKMPVNMPIYISFQILDPSQEASGYSLHFFQSQ